MKKVDKAASGGENRRWRDEIFDDLDSQPVRDEHWEDLAFKERNSLACTGLSTQNVGLCAGDRWRVGGVSRTLSDL